MTNLDQQIAVLFAISVPLLFNGLAFAMLFVRINRSLGEIGRETNQRFDAMRDFWREQLGRVERALDVRLKPYKGATMNIDERLEALTMNLELLWKDVEGLRKTVNALAAHVNVLTENMRALTEDMRTLVGATGSLTDSVARMGEDHANQISGVLTATKDLLKMAEEHERRLQRLEEDKR